MKRSKMVDILEEQITNYTDKSCCNLGINRKVISEILAILEESGIRPPSSNKDNNSGLDSSWDEE